jgi:hypothetical protein
MGQIGLTTLLAGLGAGAIGQALAIVAFRKIETRSNLKSRVRAKVDPDPYTPSRINGHIARPGPGYWDWRCLVCDFPVAEHSFWGYVWARIRGWK